MASATLSTSLDRGVADFHAGENYLNQDKGIKSWLLTLDHKRIGLMYLISGMTMFFIGGMLAEVIRTQLLVPNGLIFHGSYEAYKHYNQVFTLHGIIMVFMVLVPIPPGALGNFVLPLMIGAKDVAFPRLNLMSYYLYVVGALMALVSTILGAVDTGWTFYTPYSIQSHTYVVWMVGGIFFLGFSSIFTGLNFIVTIHKLRAPGMRWFRMPAFVWASYATSIIQVAATPVLGVTLLLLIVERVMGIGIFSAALGGDPVLFQDFFWFYSHPAVYIMILPAMGIVSELITCFSRRPLFGYSFIVMSSLAIALIGFVVWGHHLFVNGQSAKWDAIFSFLTFFVAVPSAVKVFNWLATMYKGSIVLSTPMLYALAFILLFTIGGFTGVILAALATNVVLHDTYFVVAHFHYVMFGGTIIAFLGGLHYWWPKMFGRMYSETLGKIACGLLFIGFNLTFFPQLIVGAEGMPRRYATYLPQYQGFMIVSTIGAYIQLAAFLLMAGYLIHSLFRGKKAPANPWGASTLDWSMRSPPPTENFDQMPVVTGPPYHYHDMEYDPKVGGFTHVDPIRGAIRVAVDH